jgi:drug/metabolite transporter (DMT)-like permease
VKKTLSSGNSAPTRKDRHPESHLRGIASILIAVIAFAVMDASMKQLGQHYSPLQVTSMRGFASLPFLLALVALQNRWRELIPVRWELHVLRALLSIAMLVLFVYSIRNLSLSSAYAVFLSAPLLVTALSVPLLHERVDWQRWLAIAIGLMGVVLMIRPTASDVMTLGALAAFAAAVCYAFAAILIRVSARTESTLGLSVSFVTMIALIAGAIALPTWQPVQSHDLPWIAVLGVTGCIGQYFIIEAFRHAPASVVAPFDYTALIWGAILDWVLWQTLPNSRMLTGGSVVVATGLYLIYREHSARATSTH